MSAVKTLKRVALEEADFTFISELFALVAMAHILLKVKAHEDHVSWRSLDGLHVPSL